MQPVSRASMLDLSTESDPAEGTEFLRLPAQSART
jgi:hypothetical protein